MSDNFYASAARMVGDPAGQGYPGLLLQLTYAVRVQAQQVLAGASADDDTAPVKMARKAVQDPGGIAPAFVWAVVANQTMRGTMQAMDPLKDADIQWLVGDQWATIASQQV